MRNFWSLIKTFIAYQGLARCCACKRLVWPQPYGMCVPVCWRLVVCTNATDAIK